MILGSGNASRLVVEHGAVFNGAVDGGGPPASSVLELAAGAGTFAGAGGSFVNFGSITFDSGAAWKIIGSTGALANGETISGFTKGSTIELTGVTGSIGTYVSGALSLTGSAPLSLLLPGSFSTGDFIATDTGGNTDITIACFRTGTRVLAAGGEVAVECLRVGDYIVSLMGGRLVPVAWVGVREIACGGQERGGMVWPIRVAAGAFGAGAPCHDLYLSPDHAVLVEGALIPVRYLVNGASVAQVPVETVSYWHIELAGHDAVLAEGLPAESYLDTGNRCAFASDATVVQATAI